MKVLLTGSTGQLGQAIINSKPLGIDLITTTRAQLDLSKAESCRDSILRNKPDWVINAGAYTAVDKAESEEALAMAINGEAPKVLSEALKEINGKILQISTDFVFNGSQNFPYKPNTITVKFLIDTFNFSISTFIFFIFFNNHLLPFNYPT